MMRLRQMTTVFIGSILLGINIVNGYSNELIDGLNNNVLDHFHFERFIQFKEKFNKRYETIETMRDRYNIFKNNLNDIMRHNADKSQNFTKGINQFTDMTADEFNSKYLGGITQDYQSQLYFYGCDMFSYTSRNFQNNEIEDDSLPKSVDWRYEMAVTPVKDQGQCGSCWSFSATGAMEGAWAIKMGELVSLSEQQLIDCATGIKYGSHGCNGGQMDGAFKYASHYGAISEIEYPYTSGTGNDSTECMEYKPTSTFTGCFDVVANDQLSLKAAVSKQPVSIAIEADSRYFQSYSSGVLTSMDCGTNLDHGVLIVGYGEENMQKYWLVKNSWSDSWGDGGYVKISRSDSRNDVGVCGIAMQPSFPVV